MVVDIYFEFAKVYNIERFEVVKGQKFSLQSDATEKIKWFSDNDPVLSIETSQQGTSVTAEATAVGETTILIMNEGFSELKRLSIRVVDKIEPQATDLNIIADAPILK